MPAAYGSSQARDGIGAAAASLYHYHSNVGYNLSLWPKPSSWQPWISDPLREARDWTRTFMDTSWVHFHCATTGIPQKFSNKHLQNYIYKNLSLGHLPVLLSSLFLHWVLRTCLMDLCKFFINKSHENFISNNGYKNFPHFVFQCLFLAQVNFFCLFLRL